MITLDLALSSFRSGGRARALAIAACTAVVAALLLVAVSVAQYTAVDQVTRTDTDGQVTTLVFAGNVSGILWDRGVRPGYFLGLLLICLVPLTLLQQVVRLGTAARERRLAALRLAGATPAQVRAVGAWEVGLPALVGAVLGLPAYLLVRAALGTTSSVSWIDDPAVARELRLVPDTAPPWWQVLLVLAAVVALGVAAGALASRSVVTSPLGVSRGARRGAARGWPPALAIVVGAVLAGPGYVLLFGDVLGQVSLMLGVALLVLGVLGVAPWLAGATGRAVARRTSSPAMLLAARWLVADSRAAGRAAASIGASSLVAVGAVATLADLLRGSGSMDAFYVVPIVLVLVVVLAALVVAAFSLAVHGVEALTDRRRSMASLSAEGTPVEVLVSAVRWEATLAAVPPVVLVVVGFGAPLGLLASGTAEALLVYLGSLVVLGGLVALTLVTSARIVRPWVVRAADPAHLRAT